MTAGKYDLVVEKGAQLERTLTITSSNSEFDSGISSHTFQAMIRENYGDASPAVTMQTSISDGANGVLLLLIPSSTTDAITIGGGVWDLEAVRNSDSEVVRLLEGEVIIKQSATK